MAKYDPDLIAALASGSLDPAEAAAAEAAIAADPRAGAELAAQRLALDALRRAPAPVLSATERTELRNAVAAALHLEDSPAPAPAAAARRRVPWRPLAVAAAALAALVAAVPLFGLLSLGDQDQPLSTVALEATSDARAGAEVPPAGDGTEGYGLQSEQNDEAGVLGATVPVTTTVSPALATSPDEAAMAEASRVVADLVIDPALLFRPLPAGQVVPCREQAASLLRDDAPTGILYAAESGELAIWFLSDDGATVQQLVAFDPAACAPVLAAYP
jgi:hypothetical protein